MGSKASLTNAELELTQKIQILFPRGISPDVIRAWNGCEKEIFSRRLLEIFNAPPGLKFLYEKDGFAFYERIDPGDHSFRHVFSSFGGRYEEQSVIIDNEHRNDEGAYCAVGIFLKKHPNLPLTKDNPFFFLLKCSGNLFIACADLDENGAVVWQADSFREWRTWKSEHVVIMVPAIKYK